MARSKEPQPVGMAKWRVEGAQKFMKRRHGDEHPFDATETEVVFWAEIVRLRERLRIAEHWQTCLIMDPDECKDCEAFAEQEAPDGE